MKTCGRCGATLDSGDRCDCEGLPTMDELVPYTPTTRRGFLAQLLKEWQDRLKDSTVPVYRASNEKGRPGAYIRAPRPGYQWYWQMTSEQITLIKALLAELPDPMDPAGSRRYFGWVQGLPTFGGVQLLVLGLETGEAGALVDTRLFVLPKKLCAEPAALEGKYVFVLADPHCEVTGIQEIELTEESA